MPFDRFLIAPPDGGLQTNVRPWLLPENAFAQLNNAYVFRGRVRKRFGSYLTNSTLDEEEAQLQSRLSIPLTGGAGIGTTDGAGNAAGVVNGTVFKIGQMFSIGSEIYTVWQANGAMLSTGSGSGTYNTATGAYTFAGAPALTQIYFFPSEPVMGLITYQTDNLNDEPTYAFDTQFAYQFSGGRWIRLGGAIWTGSNSQFFWGATWRGSQADDNILYVTNYNQPDNIKIWDGTTWSTINPIFNAANDTIESARIIVPFKDRLVLLNVIEQIGVNPPRTFPNRCRFSQNGDPLEVTPGQEAWLEDVPGKGGYIDAPTIEQIVTAQFLKDRLIVYFETSTWELVYTGNEILPFRWQQLNTELGAESTFSHIPFDKVVVGVGNVGVHQCNGSNVERIDEKIPDYVFDIINENNGPERVYGIRDYKTECLYWTVPTEVGTTYPNQILLYNYRNATWATNDDSITAFGYFQNTSNRTWATTDSTWEVLLESWNSGTTIAKFPQIIGGNQEGFVFIVDPDESRNAASLQITNLTIALGVVTLYIRDHNLQVGDFITIENAQGITTDRLIYQIRTVVDANQVTIEDSAGISGTYLGGGTSARVSVIDIYTKQYNFYIDQARNAQIQKIDFHVDRTAAGEISVAFLPSATNLQLQPQILETSPYAIYPYEAQAARLWHPVYFNADGEFIQLRLFLSDAEMIDSDISLSDFQMHAMAIFTQPTSSRLQ